jgi:hypothetical protein
MTARQIGLLRQRTYFRRSAGRALLASTSRDVHALQINKHSSEMKLSLRSSPLGIVSPERVSMNPSQHAH